MKAKTLILSLLSLFVFSILTVAANADTTFKGDKDLEQISLKSYTKDVYCDYGTEKMELNQLIAKHGDNAFDAIKTCCDARVARVQKCTTYMNETGDTPIAIAAFYGWPRVVRYLVVELGESVDTRGTTGYNPLMYTSAQGHKKTAEELVALNADVTKLSAQWMKDAQFFAGYYKKQDVYNYLGEVKKKLGLSAAQIKNLYQNAADELFKTFKAPENMAESIAQIEIMPMYKEIQNMIKDGNKI